MFTQICEVTDTVEIIKKKLLTNPENPIDEKKLTTTMFKIIGAGFLSNEHEPVKDIPYFENSKKRKDDPKFMLVHRGSSYHKAVRARFGNYSDNSHCRLKMMNLKSED